ncbi:UNVERIFIED_ORG: hypothetical protein JN05_04491 [Zoogloea ramigera]
MKSPLIPNNLSILNANSLEKATVKLHRKTEVCDGPQDGEAP